MVKLEFRDQNLLYSYFFLVFISAIVLFLRNPIPFIREDIWAEDGREYLAGIINYGFWKALYLNFLDKGYMQFFKFLVAALCLEINRFFFNENILIVPKIVAIISYLIYAFIFCLPLLLFYSKIKIKYLIAIIISNCFINIGLLDHFLVFGRILNFGFLSIYFCFLLVGDRILFFDKHSKISLFAIDLLIFLCIITQPINILLLLFI
ncbi:hypothetical protein IQ238_07340 [Pleurocapsales cyanobacterium LEGE 06147]|nr:hypothetical protein [Pleurocapsales cyanobacterium LEGE 06147]